MAPATLSLSASPIIHNHQNALDHLSQTGTRAGANAVFLICLVICTILGTIRMRQYLKVKIWTFSRLLAASLYVNVITYLLLFNMFSSGVGLRSFELCKAVIYICLIFYGGMKFIVFLFMAERVHTVRSVQLTRREDKLWIATIVVIIVCFSGIVAFAMHEADYQMTSTGLCKLGIPDVSTYGVFVFDTLVSFWMGGLFLYFLLPTIKEHAELYGDSNMSTFVRRLAGISGKRQGDGEIQTQVMHAQPTIVLPQTPAPAPAPAWPLSDVPKSPTATAGRRGSAFDMVQILSHGPITSLKDEGAGIGISEHKPSICTSQPSWTTTPTTSAPSSSPTLQTPTTMNLHTEPHGFDPTQTSASASHAVIKKLDTLVKKSLWAVLILFIACVGNASTYWYFRGYEPAWLCFTVCSLDLTVAVGVVHWLTSTQEEA